MAPADDGTQAAVLRKLVLLPCAETELAAKTVMVGWAQDLLTAKGTEQAQKAGKQLAAAGFAFDALFTSVQKQSIHTAWTALMETGAVAVQHVQSYRLNERFCGELQGMTMQEAEAKHGKEKLKEWMKDAPPALEAADPRNLSNDPLYRALPQNSRPNTESLQAVCERVVPVWTDGIGPFVLSGKSVLVTGHESSLRAMAQMLENLTDSEALEEQLPPGVPVVYEVDEDLDFIRKYTLDSQDKKRILRKQPTMTGAGAAAPAANAAAPAGPAAAPAPAAAAPVAAAETPKPKKVVPKKPAPPPPPPIKEVYKFNVNIVSGKGLRNSDWFSNADPYVWGKVVGKNEKTFRTPTLSLKEEVVTWNHMETLELKQGDKLQLFVYDDDWGPDDMLGMCELPFEFLENDFEGRLRLVDNRGKAMPGKTGKGAFLTVAVQEEE
jgi:2,3-bisphosphoglycerate-dependent phosphoglycerate mutase